MSKRFGLLLAAMLSGCGEEAPPLADAALLEGGPAEAAAGEGQPGDGRPFDTRAGDGPRACSAGPALLGRVSAARMLADLQQLTSSERTSAAGQARAADYIEKQLVPLGLAVRRLSYTYNSASYANLEASLTGELTDRYVFVGAHYDAASGSPGADDDASGTAAVLELARALSGCKLKRTVRFLFFSNEDAGTVGSTRYVQSLKTEVPPDRVVGLVELDMVGYAPAGEDLDVASRPAYASLVDDTVAAMNRWTTLPAKKVVKDSCG